MEEKDELVQERKTQNLLLIIIAALLLLIAALFFIGKGGEAEPQMEADPRAVQGLIAGRSAEEIQALLDAVVEEGMFHVSINGEITVGEDGNGDVCIENIETNRYLMQVDIVVTDSRGTEVTVYSSGLIAPGYSIESSSFQVLPPPGYSDAMAVFTAFDAETMQKAGQTQAAVILIREAA